MEETIKKLSQELNLPQEVISKTYKLYWLYIRKTIEKLPLKDNLNKEEFSKLRPNFNIPGLGKLVCTYERYINSKIRLKDKYAKYKEDKTNSKLLSNNEG